MNIAPIITPQIYVYMEVKYEADEMGMNRSVHKEE